MVNSFNRLNRNNIVESLKMLFIVFICFYFYLYCWVNSSGANVHGVYSNTDGQLAAWYTKFLVNWSRPWEMSTINPFQGQVSLFFANSVWWNPGALALSLPLSTVKTYLISYSIYWFEIFASLYWLARTMGLNKNASFFVPQLYLLFLCPPFSGYFESLHFLSLAPFNAHLVAMANIITVLYIKIGSSRSALPNLAILFSMILCFFIATMSGAVTWLTYLPIYCILCLGLTWGSDKRSLLWKSASVLTITLAFVLMGSLNYYKGTSLISTASIASIQTSFLLPALSDLIFNPCYYPSSGLFCTQYKISILHIFAFLSGVIGVFFYSGKKRALSIAFCIAALLPELLSFLVYNNALQGPLTQLHSMFLTWSAYPFYCIIATLGLFQLLGWIQSIKSLERIMSWFIVLLNNSFRIVIRSFIFLWTLTMHCMRMLLFSSKNLKEFIATGNFQFLTPIVGILAIFIIGNGIWWGALSKNAKYFIESPKTTIIQYLQKNIALYQGDRFRGSVVTFIGSKDSITRKLIDPKNLKGAYHALYYVRSRDLLLEFHGNRHMFSDLWQHNIPSLEEYGQWITFPIFHFFQHLLADPEDMYYRNFLNVYKLNPAILAALGARYIITDKLLQDETLTLRLTQAQHPDKKKHYIPISQVNIARSIYKRLQSRIRQKGRIPRERLFSLFKQEVEQNIQGSKQDKSTIIAGFSGAEYCQFLNKYPLSYGTIEMEAMEKYFMGYLDSISNFEANLYLYEINKPNIANYSPTHLIKLDSAKTIYEHLSRRDFSFEEEMIIHEDLGLTLSKALNSSMEFHRNEIHVKAKASGWSALLLPVQFSRCYTLTNNKGESDSIRFVRANLVQSAIIFKNTLDVKLHFKFGLGNHSECRMRDIADLRELGLDPSEIDVPMDPDLQILKKIKKQASSVKKF